MSGLASGGVSPLLRYAVDAVVKDRGLRPPARQIKTLPPNLHSPHSIGVPIMLSEFPA